MKRLILFLIAATLLPCSVRAQTAISDLTNLSSLASGDLLPVVDVSDTSVAVSGKTKKVTMSVLTGYIGTLAMELTDKTITAPAITGGTAIELIGFSLRSTGAAFDLGIASDEVLTADRTLKFTLGNANRRITLAGDLTFAGAVTTGGAVTFSGAFAFTATLTADTTLTFPASGTVLSTASTISLSQVSGTLAQLSTAVSDDNIPGLGAANTFTLANTFSATTASTSSTTGAVIVSGGVGIAKDSWINTVRVGMGAGSVDSNTVLGTAALGSNVTGVGITAIGRSSLTSNTGNNRTAIGAYSGLAFTSGTGGDVAIGTNSLVNATTASYSVGIGYEAGRYQLDGTTALALTGDGNIMIGARIRGVSNAQANSITIGDQGLSDGPNTTVLGNTSTTAARIEGVVTMPDGIRVPSVECQNVVATTSTPANTGTAIPLDNTIPQNTEGAQAMSVTITPTSATSTLEITFVGFFSHSAGAHVTVALFQDSTANALTTTSTYINTAAVLSTIPLRYTMTAGTTSATTFKIRYGPPSGTAYFLQLSSGAVFSTAIQGVLQVREIRP